MKLRCPYCRTEFLPQDSSKCPSCGKFMRIASPYRKTPRREKNHDYSRRDDRTRAKPSGRLARNLRVLLTIFVILAIVAGLLVYRTKPPDRRAVLRKSWRELATYDLEAHGNGLKAFKLHSGRFPTTQEGLKALVLNPCLTNWHGPYTTKPLLDPWYNKYKYSCSNGIALLFCMGQDGVAGTTNDMYDPRFRPPPLPDRAKKALEDWKKRKAAER